MNGCLGAGGGVQKDVLDGGESDHSCVEKQNL